LIFQPGLGVHEGLSDNLPQKAPQQRPLVVEVRL